MSTYDSTIYINQALGLSAGELLDKLELNKGYDHGRLKIGPANIRLADAMLKDEVAVGEWNNCTIISSNALSNIWIGSVPLRLKLMKTFPDAQMVFIFHESVANSTFLVWVDKGEKRRLKVTQQGHIVQHAGDLLDLGAPLDEEYELYQVPPGEEKDLRKNKDYKAGQHDYDVALNLLRKYIFNGDDLDPGDLVLNKDIDTYFTDDDLLDRNFQIDKKAANKAIYDLTYQSVKSLGFKKESVKAGAGSINKIFSKKVEDGTLVVHSEFYFNTFKSTVVFESQYFTDVWMKANAYDRSPVRGPELANMFITRVNTKRAYEQAMSQIAAEWNLLAPNLPEIGNIRDVEAFYVREGLLEKRYQEFLSKDKTNDIVVDAFRSLLVDRVVLSYCSGSSQHEETVKRCRELFPASSPDDDDDDDLQTFNRAAALKVGS